MAPGYPYVTLFAFFCLAFLVKINGTYVEFRRLVKLQDHLQQNQPCIAFIHTKELSYWTDDVDYAVVVVGLDEQHIYVNDPAFPSGPLTIDRGEFDLAWLE